MIGKTKIATSFSKTSENYAEVSLTQECTNEECSNILPLYETFEDDQTLYMVTKYMQGGTLAGLLKGPVQEDVVRKIFAQIAKGV